MPCRPCRLPEILTCAALLLGAAFPLPGAEPAPPRAAAAERKPAVPSVAGTIGVTITPDQTVTNASPLVFRVNFAAPVTGLSVGSFVITNASAPVLAGSGAAYTLSFPTPPVSVPISLSLPENAVFTASGAGNVAAAATYVTYDPATAYLFRADFIYFLPGGWLLESPWIRGGIAPAFAQVRIGSAGTYPAGVQAGLVSPKFVVPAQTPLPAWLRFLLQCSTRAGEDGGVLQISVDGAPFAAVPPALVAYNSPAVAALGGIPGWSGVVDDGFGYTTPFRVNLATWAGRTVRFRWLFASGGTPGTTVSGNGFALDEVSVELDPVVNVSAPQPLAVERGSQPGRFQLTAQPTPPRWIRVPFLLGGSAVNGTDYQISASSGTFPGGASTQDVYVTPQADVDDAPRAQSVVLTLLPGDGYTVGASSQALVTILGDGAFDVWRAGQFTPAELADPTIAGPQASPAATGVPNFLRYALGLGRMDAPVDRLPVAEIVERSGINYLQLRYVRPAGLPDVNYLGEVSGDLGASWNADPAAVETTVLPNTPAPGWETVTYRDFTPLGPALPESTNRFLRLRVQPRRNPPANPVADPRPHPLLNAYPLPGAYTDADANPHAYPDPHADAHQHPDSDHHPHAHPNREPHADRASLLASKSRQLDPLDQRHHQLWKRDL